TRDEPRPEITVRLRSLERKWTVASLDALVTHLNELFHADPAAKAIAILGEYEDALQLWAVDKALLGELLGEDFFRPRNRKQLTKLAHTPTSCGPRARLRRWDGALVFWRRTARAMLAIFAPSAQLSLDCCSCAQLAPPWPRTQTRAPARSSSARFTKW